jgi:hypothetical protein
MEWVTGDLVDKLSAPGLLLLFFLLNMLGYIRPNRAVAEVRADRDARLADKDRQIDIWREALAAERSAREKQDETVRESLEAVRAANDALRGFRNAAEVYAQALAADADIDRRKGATG